jgi:hypothetical protein
VVTPPAGTSPTAGKVASPPAASTLVLESHHLRHLNTTLWRIHFTAGKHVISWNDLRYFGPVGSRFDPHDPPPSLQAKGVSYAALGLTTALAEVFQNTRTISRHRDSPFLTAWAPTRPLKLLDLSGNWPILNGGASVLMMVSRALCRSWARVIHSTWPDVDGLYSRSTMNNEPTCALFTEAANSFPSAPIWSVPLSAPGVYSQLKSAAREINYTLL